MFQTNSDRRSLRSVLLLGAASATAMGFSASALAQDQSSELVVVTGSRIPQAGLYSPSPVTAVGQQEMKLEGTTGVETLLNNLPSVFAGQTTGESNGATGTATANLRGLGATRTLVLVNGTRLAPGDPTLPSPDLNQIPSALVDHVEVLTGAASAVYGSDAVAGVVNFIMRKDFEGIEVDGQYGITESDNSNSTYRSIVASAGDQLAKQNAWDGASDTGTLILGTNTADGKGNVTGYIGYFHSEPVAARERDYSACTFGSAGFGHACGGSSTFNRITSIDETVAHAPKAQSSLFETGNGAQGSGNYVPYVSANSQLFNFGATNFLQREDTRYTGGFFAHYQVNKELDVYSSFMFMDDDTTGQIAARGLFFGVGAVSGSEFQINCANPLLIANGNEDKALCGNLAGDALVGGAWNGAANVPSLSCPHCAPGQATVEIGRRAIEGGPQDTEYRHTSFRSQLGARGDLGDGWSYDAYAQYSTTVWQSNQMAYFSTRNIAQALQVTGTAAHPVCVSGGACVPLDIFSGLGSITPNMLGFVQVPAIRVGYTEEQIVSGNLTGDLGEWGIQSPWAKSPVAVSIGTEYRAEYIADTPDEEFQTADLNGGGGARAALVRSGFNVVEGFGELKVPVIQDKPFAEDLSFNTGYRYSSYSTAGAVTAYKYGAEWQPIDDIRFRASYERAVRAPDVLELFSKPVVGLASAQDPCATAGNTLVACASVPNNGNTALLTCPSNQCNVQTGGNVNLKPEIGNTRTIGAIFTPTFIDGFTATVDYYNIDIAKRIGTVPVQLTLNQCYLNDNPFFCGLVHRSTLGQIYGNGFVSGANVNTGFTHTKGFDIESNYTVSLDDWSWTKGNGSLQFTFIGTWMQSFVIEPVPGQPTEQCAGLFGPICSAAGAANAPLPKWRDRLRATWETPWDIDFSANWRYLSSVSLDTNTAQKSLSNGKTNHADATINAFWYLDLGADWNVREGVSVHGGINNIFDRLPPALGSSVLPTGPGNDNTFPGTYDAMGRTIFVGATIKY